VYTWKVNFTWLAFAPPVANSSRCATTRSILRHPKLAFWHWAYDRITVRVRIGKNIIWELPFSADIPHNDFLDPIYTQTSRDREFEIDRPAVQRVAGFRYHPGYEDSPQETKITSTWYVISIRRRSITDHPDHLRLYSHPVSRKTDFPQNTPNRLARFTFAAPCP